MELFKASQQWSTRPADETFPNVQTAFEAAKHYAASAAEKANVPLQSVRTEVVDSEVCLTGRGGIPARVSNWAFGQLARMADAPAGYLRTLPATLAAQNLNYGLKSATDANPDQSVNIMAHSNGSILVRALTSNRYARIWNYEVLGRMLPLEADGWTCPTPFRTSTATAANPDPTVYVSDHDMFAFLVREDYRIAEPGNPEGLARGFFVENSEVGASSLKVTTFLYRFMCANHIVWGAKDVSELAVRHIGKARGNLSTMFIGMTDYLNESASDLESEDQDGKKPDYRHRPGKGPGRDLRQVARASVPRCYHGGSDARRTAFVDRWGPEVLLGPCARYDPVQPNSQVCRCARRSR